MLELSARIRGVKGVVGVEDKVHDVMMGAQGPNVHSRRLAER